MTSGTFASLRHSNGSAVVKFFEKKTLINTPMTIRVFCISFYLIDKDGSYWSSSICQKEVLQ